MDFDGDFRWLGECDVSALQNQVLALPEDTWLEYGQRQKRFDAHASTHSIPLLYDEDFRFVSPTKRARYGDFEDVVVPLANQVAAFFGGHGYFLRILLARLQRNAVISPHCDDGDSLLFVHRIHVPVITNPAVFFSVGSERRHLAPGEVWEINNARQHSVINESRWHRVHLIFDYVTPDLTGLWQKAWGAWANEAREVLTLLKREVLQGNIADVELVLKTKAFWKQVDGMNARRSRRQRHGPKEP